MRISLKFFKWVGISLVVLLALFIGINAFDETLDPGAAAIWNAKSKIKPEDNAYFYWSGMRTAISNNPGEVGRQCVSAQLKAAAAAVEAAAEFSGLDNIPECREQNVLKVLEDKNITCEWRKRPCLNQYFEQRAAIDRLVAENQVLMERYGHLLEFKQFDDTHYLHPTVVSPTTFPVRLYQAVSASRLQDGDSSSFIRRTQNETRFYRLILTSDSSLLSKMIGAAGLERTSRLVSDAVKADPQLAQQQSTALLGIVSPLTLKERSLGTAMEGEARFSAYALSPDSMKKRSFWGAMLYGLTVKKNASANFIYRNLSVWRELSELPTEKYSEAEKSALGQLTTPWRDGYLRMVYNPVGKVLASIGSESYANYPRRMIDMDGLLRLTSLQIQIAAQQIPESEITTFLQSAAPQFRDPYTGQPLQWEKSRGIYFKGYGKVIPDQDGIISVKL